MQKMKLRLDDLRIDSFSTSDAKGEHGTVHGHDCVTCTNACNCNGTAATDCGCGSNTCYCGTAYTDCGDCELSRDGGNYLTCAVECFSHYTDCHRC